MAFVTPGSREPHRPKPKRRAPAQDAAVAAVVKALVSVLGEDGEEPDDDFDVREQVYGGLGGFLDAVISHKPPSPGNHWMAPDQGVSAPGRWDAGMSLRGPSFGPSGPARLGMRGMMWDSPLPDSLPEEMGPDPFLDLYGGMRDERGEIDDLYFGASAHQPGLGSAQAEGSIPLQDILRRLGLS